MWELALYKNSIIYIYIYIHIYIYIYILVKYPQVWSMHLTLYFLGRPVQSITISASLRSISS